MCTKIRAMPALKNIHGGPKNKAKIGPRGHLLMPPHGPLCNKEQLRPHIRTGGSKSWELQ